MEAGGLPGGTVTFLFTDVEGSTKLLRGLGPDAYAAALEEHRRLLRDAFRSRGGVEVDTQGDAFFYAFTDAASAVEAAAAGQAGLAAGPIKVRVGLHTGSPLLTHEGYVGEDVNLAARIAACGHGGQVLLSEATQKTVQVEATDLGEHRLKDFDEPVWIFQLGDERFPPLKSLSNTNLPRPADQLIGRSQELGDLIRLFQEDARLVTLTGPGGTGKTRLAFEVAARLVPETKNGVFWVDLSPLRDPALVLDGVGQVLGAQGNVGDHVGGREMLLLLDNFEHVLPAAVELPPLLGRCPNLRILVTSRERLAVQGELEYHVAPMTRRDAVELFCTRSGLPADAPIEQLCARLDDLPLAIELAAARTKLLSPQGVLDRIGKRLDLLKGGRDADPRQATLRAAIEWSYELLDAEERLLFERLAVFRGGATVEAAETVIDADLDALQSLAEKSLLRRRDERLLMLETIGDLARELFEAADDADRIRDAHADYFLDLAETYEADLIAHEKDALDRMAAEWDNFRAALQHLTSRGRTEDALRLAGSLWNLWGIRGSLSEGVRTLEAVLGGYDGAGPARAKALLALSDLASGLGDLTLAERAATDALVACRRLGDRNGEGSALLGLADAAAARGDYAASVRLGEDAASAFEEVGNRHDLLLAKRMLVWFLAESGQRPRAIALCEEALGEARRMGNDHLLTQLLEARAFQLTSDGHVVEAMRLLQEAFETHVQLGDDYRLVIMMYRFARVLERAGHPRMAARLLGAYDAQASELGIDPAWVRRDHTDTAKAVRSALGAELFEREREAGFTLTFAGAASIAVQHVLPANDRPRGAI